MCSSTADRNAAATAGIPTIDGRRLWARLMAMADIGRRGETGVDRAAFSPEDRKARRLLYEWGCESGLEASQDSIGNLFLRYPGRDPGLAPVLTGSHLDSQPTGGRFDGAFGVLAGLEAVASLARAGLRPARSIDVVAWSNEEGGRFAPGAMGSQVYAGVLPLASMLAARDASGTLLRDALADTLAALPGAGMRPRGNLAGSTPAAYLEAHIEQGPRLEREGMSVGVVNGIQGCLWIEYDVSGTAAHAGTTPHEYRRDAFEGAVRLIDTLRARCLARSPGCRFTVGRVLVEPNTPNTIPGQVTFTVDFRDADPDAFAELSRGLRNVPSPEPFELKSRELFRHAPLLFPRDLVTVVAEAARSHGHRVFELVSGAFHDALFIAGVCPTGMIFVRCRGGVSHNPLEYAEPADLAAGAQVLMSALLRLSSS
jgi:N-carbamoyl-L-amino-acid hydrolase